MENSYEGAKFEIDWSIQVSLSTCSGTAVNINFSDDSLVSAWIGNSLPNSDFWLSLGDKMVHSLTC